MTTGASNNDKISMALLAQAGIDHTKVFAVSYQHRVGEVPTLTVECYVTRADGELDIEAAAYEWRLRGKTRTIRPGTPEWDTWLASLPHSEDQP